MYFDCNTRGEKLRNLIANAAIKQMLHAQSLKHDMTAYLHVVYILNQCG